MYTEKCSIHSERHSVAEAIMNCPKSLHTELAPPCPENRQSIEHSKFIKLQVRKFNFRGYRIRKLLSAIPVQIKALQQIIYKYLDLRNVNTKKIDEILGNRRIFNISYQGQLWLSIEIVPTRGLNYNIYLRLLAPNWHKQVWPPIVSIDYGATAIGLWEFITYQSQLPERSEIWQFPASRYLDGDARPEGAIRLYAFPRDWFPHCLSAVRDSLRAEVGMICAQESA